MSDFSLVLPGSLQVEPQNLKAAAQAQLAWMRLEGTPDEFQMGQMADFSPQCFEELLTHAQLVCQPMFEANHPLFEQAEAGASTHDRMLALMLSKHGLQSVSAKSYANSTADMLSRDESAWLKLVVRNVRGEFVKLPRSGFLANENLPEAYAATAKRLQRKFGY